MKNIVILEHEEVAHIFSHEGFKLFLADEQTITIKAEGAKMSNGDLTVFAAHVHGDAETVQTVLKEFSNFLLAKNSRDDRSSTGSPRAEISTAHPELVEGPVPIPQRRQYKKRIAGGSERGPSAARSAKTVCDHCQRKFTTWQGRARHQGSCEKNPDSKKKDPARLSGRPVQ